MVHQIIPALCILLSVATSHSVSMEGEVMKSNPTANRNEVADLGSVICKQLPDGTVFYCPDGYTCCFKGEDPEAGVCCLSPSYYCCGNNQCCPRYLLIHGLELEGKSMEKKVGAKASPFKSAPMGEADRTLSK